MYILIVLTIAAINFCVIFHLRSKKVNELFLSDDEKEIIDFVVKNLNWLTIKQIDLLDMRIVQIINKKRQNKLNGNTKY